MEQKKIELKPGDPQSCTGSGDHGLECQCDECNYLMDCMAKFDRKPAERHVPAEKPWWVK